MVEGLLFDEMEYVENDWRRGVSYASISWGSGFVLSFLLFEPNAAHTRLYRARRERYVIVRLLPFLIFQAKRT